MFYRLIIYFSISFTIFSYADKGELDELYRYRNLGGAYFEENKLAEAIQEFKACIKINPTFAQDHINLGMAYLDYSKYSEAIEELQTAKKLAPGYPHIYYNLALIYKRQGKFAEAVREFQKVIQLDPDDVATHYNLGISYSRIQEVEKAREEFRRVVELEPEHSGAHYHLWRIALRAKRTKEANEELKIFQYLRKSTSSAEKSTASSSRELEEGKYTKLVAILPQPSKQDRPASTPVRFVDVSDAAGLKRSMGIRLSESIIDLLKANIGSGASFGDYDNDGDLDLYILQTGANALFRNKGNGAFTDVTEQADVGDAGVGVSCAFGDYDNDGDLDLYVANAGANVLYQNDGDGHFTDVTQKAGVGHSAFSADAVFVDYDHDGDLDLYVANYVALPETPDNSNALASLPGADNVMYRNNGDGTFTDVTDESKLGGYARKSRRILPVDFDNDNDIDLYVVNEDAPNLLYTNLRGGKFKNVAEQIMPEAPIGGLSAAIGDYNADGWMDIYLTTVEGKKNILYHNKSVLTGQKSPSVFAMESANKSLTDSKLRISQVSFLDYDNDGYLDLFFIDDSKGEARLLRNRGNSRFDDVSDEMGLSQIPLKNSKSFAFGDYDNDGDLDILILDLDSAPTLLRNEGGNANNWLKLKLTGRRNNKDGIASKVEVKAGRFYQKRELFNRVLNIGLGARSQLDSVRVKWPNGIIQNSINVSSNQLLILPEKEGPPGSCPFLYVWDGEGYKFVTDFLDVAALGVLADESNYLLLDSDEYVKIDGNRIKPKDGLYRMQITEELQEIVYLDELKLLAVDHPADVDIYPNEMFTAPPFPEFHIYTVKNARPPVSAVDDRGNDILPAISKRDRIYPTNVRPLSYLGMAEEHSIILDLGDLSEKKKILLLLTGWVNWGDSTSNLAVAQNKLLSAILPYLQVINSSGEWETVIPSLGFQAGIDKTATIDLTDKFLTNDYRIKITTNMEIYWDRILVSALVDEAPTVVRQLKLHSADLYRHGYSKSYSPDGRLPMLYDYNDVSHFPPWRHAAGRYTRYGDVRPLLEKSDNQYVIMSHGDGISVSFDAPSSSGQAHIPPPQPGWTRDFILYSSGWIKDGDPNTAFSTTVAPMPFGRMSAYPYPSTESYPYDLENIRYIQQYNTRALGERETEGR